MLIDRFNVNAQNIADHLLVQCPSEEETQTTMYFERNGKEVEFNDTTEEYEKIRIIKLRPQTPSMKRGDSKTSGSWLEDIGEEGQRFTEKIENGIDAATEQLADTVESISTR